ncbi:DHH family phosphoesterase [Mycoplasmopsis columbina]|uniref:DHH family phosphoesterase n=2 Tax=Mycoplasmopsis columbina TaxID=114881 RepID=UPI0004A6AC10|nr:DHH family phosphoesterase [Mycoplasmopsis columbina]VEU77024.1 Probable manganese-dependent inorganic pyrophosphatase [Mycoplasmopsis columbina]
MKKKFKQFLYMFSATIGAVLFISLLVFYLIKNQNSENTENLNIHLSTFLIVGIILSFIIFILFSLLIVKSYSRKQIIAKESFSSYMDEIINHNMLGTIIFDIDGKILWTSKFIRKRFGRKWIGDSVENFFQNVNIKLSEVNKEFEFQHQTFYYSVNMWNLENSLSIKDITLEKRVLEVYDQDSLVLGEIEIDNYQLYQSTLSEEQIYNVNKEVVKVLDNLVTKYNLVYRQYNTNGKFLIITNKNSIEQMKEEEFQFFKELHDILKNNDKTIMISVSAGFAVGTSNILEKMEQAKQALLQAQNRGGDQVAIFSNINMPLYYGSSKEILPSVDRTKVKAITYLIDKKMKNKEIKKVIVYGHANADLDAIGSALGIVALAKAYKKEAYICTSTQDQTTIKAIDQYFDHDDEIFIKPRQADNLTDESTLVFLVDNSHPNRTDNPNLLLNAKDTNVFVLDHHRLGMPIDFAPKQNRIIDPSASSASEIVSEILMFSSKNVNLDTRTAQMLLNGIYLDTLQFQKHVTSKTFEAASWLQSKGADSVKSSEALKINAEIYEKINEVLSTLQEVKPGFYLAYKDIPLSNDVISIAAEEILRISGRKASFVVAKTEKGDKYKLSARGIDTNVQIIAEMVGGGGHFGTAAATTSKESLEEFIDNIKQAIVSVKHESNINKRL